MALSRRLLRIVTLAPLVTIAPAVSVGAQPAVEAQRGTPPQRIDLLVPVEEVEGPLEDCSAEQEAAAISGEIVVCRRRGDRETFGFNSDRASDRYARETMDKGDLRPPDVAGAGIFRGPATVGGVCGIGLNRCPPPPAYFIDFSTLPDAPPGSDADRIARGLPPLGKDAGSTVAASAAKAEELGLPPVEGTAPVSPAGSALPVVEPQD